MFFFKESMNRPVSGSDFGYQIPLKGGLVTIIDGNETEISSLKKKSDYLGKPQPYHPYHFQQKHQPSQQQKAPFLHLLYHQQHSLPLVPYVVDDVELASTATPLGFDVGIESTAGLGSATLRTTTIPHQTSTATTATIIPCFCQIIDNNNIDENQQQQEQQQYQQHLRQASTLCLLHQQVSSSDQETISMTTRLPIDELSNVRHKGDDSIGSNMLLSHPGSSTFFGVGGKGSTVSQLEGKHYQYPRTGGDRRSGSFSSVNILPVTTASKQQPRRYFSEEHDEAYLQYQKSLLTRSPSYRKSLDRFSQSSENPSHRSLMASHSSNGGGVSSHSLNTISLEQEELMSSNHTNLRDELLNCEHKDLFQFLQDIDQNIINGQNHDQDQDHERDYHQKIKSSLLSQQQVAGVAGTVAEGTVSLRKPSTSSIKSNLSYISNSLLQNFDAHRNSGASFTGKEQTTNGDCVSLGLGSLGMGLGLGLGHSEFDHIIKSFEKELDEIKKSTTSLERRLSTLSEPSPVADEANKVIMEHIAIINSATERTTCDEVLHTPNPYDSYDVSAVTRHSTGVQLMAPRRQQNFPVQQQQQQHLLHASTIMKSLGDTNGNGNGNGHLKRRGLEKQQKIDDNLHIADEIHKIYQQLQPLSLATATTSTAVTGAAIVEQQYGNGNGSGSSVKIGIGSGVISPFTRRKSKPGVFSDQIDRFKRKSLIERVDELPEEEKANISTLQIVSERLPRRILPLAVTNARMSLQGKSCEKYNDQNEQMIDSCWSLKNVKSFENLMMQKEMLRMSTKKSVEIEEVTTKWHKETENKQKLEHVERKRDKRRESKPQDESSALSSSMLVVVTEQPLSISVTEPSHPPKLQDVDRAAAHFRSTRTESRSLKAMESTETTATTATFTAPMTGILVPTTGSFDIVDSGIGDGGKVGSVDVGSGNGKNSIRKQRPSLNKQPWHYLVSYVHHLTVGWRGGTAQDKLGSDDEQLTFPNYTDDDDDTDEDRDGVSMKGPKIPKVPDDCFPQKCYDKYEIFCRKPVTMIIVLIVSPVYNSFYFRCPWFMSCMDTKSAKHWTKIRSSVLTVVDTPAFEWFVLVLIFASSITLCFEDIYLDNNESLKQILYWTNFFFCLVFIVEMVLKWLALGFAKYFTSFWTILDFIIVFVRIPFYTKCYVLEFNLISPYNKFLFFICLHF